MKLINEKKFLKELKEITTLKVTQVDWVYLLSKHLKDLPKKKTYTKGYGYDDDTMAHSEGGDGYNQCLKDCEEVRNV